MMRAASLLLALLLAGAAQAQPACGINHNFIAVDMAAVPRCGISEEASLTILNRAFLTRWQEPGMADAVRAQLHTMHEQGMRALRILVWYGQADSLPRNVFDARRDAARAGAHAADLLRMAQAIGFDMLILGFDAVATASPGCRLREWADCFAPDTIPASAAFVGTVAQAAVEAVPDVVIDLHNEGCSVDGMRPQLRIALARKHDALAAELARRLPAGTQVTMSAIMQRGLPCLVNSLRLLEAHGLRHGPLDVHVYDANSAALVPAAAELAQRAGRSLIIGEAPLGGPPEVLTALSRAIAAAPRDAVRAVLFWPVARAGTACHVTVAPPYAPPPEAPCALGR